MPCSAFKWDKAVAASEGEALSILTVMEIRAATFGEGIEFL